MPVNKTKHVSLSALFLALLSFGAEASGPFQKPDPEKFDNFNNGYGILAGAAYVQIEGRIQYARVTKPLPNGFVEVQHDKKHLTLPADKVAVIDDATCWRATSFLCVGDTVRGPKGSSGRVAGFFPPSGDALISDGSKLERWANDSIKPTASEASSVELTSIREAIRKKRRLHLRDFLQAWNPSAGLRSWQKVPPDGCTNSELYDRRLKLNAGNFLAPECRPEVLYSWSLPFRAEWFRREAGRGRPWRKKPLSFNLFAARSPSATFGYGSYDESGGQLMRIEIAPSAKFKFLGINAEKIDCREMPEREARDTVYVRLIHKIEPARLLKEPTSEDFFLCSLGPIKAWSEGTKQLYDELSTDVKRALSAQSLADWNPYTANRNEKDEPFWPVFMNNIMGDAHPFTQRQLINSFKKLLIQSADNDGGVFYNPDYK